MLISRWHVGGSVRGRLVPRFPATVQRTGLLLPTPHGNTSLGSDRSQRVAEPIQSSNMEWNALQLEEHTPRIKHNKNKQIGSTGQPEDGVTNNSQRLVQAEILFGAVAATPATSVVLWGDRIVLDFCLVASSFTNGPDRALRRPS